MGFTGDVQVFMSTALYNMNLDAFFVKWTTDLIDAQGEDGIYPYFAPNLPKYLYATPGWSDCGVTAPWDVYLFYGDKKILERNYGGMVKWVLYQQKNSDGLIAPNRGIGDWLQPNPKPKKRMHGKRYAPDTPTTSSARRTLSAQPTFSRKRRRSWAGRRIRASSRNSPKTSAQRTSNALCRPTARLFRTRKRRI